METVYIDEAFEYIKAIHKQHLSDALLQLAIVANPHQKKPETLVKVIDDELKKLEDNRNIELDVLPEKGAFDKIRAILGKKRKKQK